MMPQLNFERTPVTLLLMVTIAALEVLGMLDNASRTKFYNEGLGILPRIWLGELWRPFTTTLLHGDLLHALFNLYWLAIFGATIEYWLGSPRMGAMVVFLAFASTLPQFLVSNYIHFFPNAPDLAPILQVKGISPDKGVVGTVGFSGVNYGFFGLLWVGRRYRSEFYVVCNPSVVQLMVAWFFICIVLTQLNLFPVANVAHGVGILFGALLGLTIFRRRERWKWGSLLAAATAIVLAMLVFPPWSWPITRLG